MSTTDQTADAYRRAFARAGTATYRLDATPWYLFSKEAIKRISESTPNARFIVLLRNPADQVISQHRHHVKVGFEREVDLRRAIESPAPPDPDEFRVGLDYLAAARVGEQLRRLFDHVSRRQVTIVSFSDLRRDPQAVYRELLDWLELPLIEPRTYDRRNPGMEVKSRRLHRLALAGMSDSMPRLVRSASLRLSRANLRPPSGPAPEHLRRWLLEELEPDIRLLESVLDRSFDHWVTGVDRRPTTDQT